MSTIKNYKEVPISSSGSIFSDSASSACWVLSMILERVSFSCPLFRFNIFLSHKTTVEYQSTKVDNARQQHDVHEDEHFGSTKFSFPRKLSRIFISIKGESGKEKEVCS